MLNAQCDKQIISFRQVNASDETFLYRLRIATMNPHLIAQGMVLTAKMHRQRVREHYWQAYIIQLEDVDIGVLKYQLDADKIHIRQIQITPSFQNQGIGTKVLRAVINQAKSQHKFVSLRVLKSNPARQLYLRLGFEVVEETEIDYYLKYS